tara:strand:+ start:3660 stop:4685 length:1026 start_codon:yes stop_codon:yes gene_type:complete
MKKTSFSGSVRVDLIGGTLDIYPINVVLEEVFTLNCATSLMASVEIEDSDDNTFRLESKDYGLVKEYSVDKLKSFSYSEQELGPLKFLMLILKELQPSSGLRITLSSNAPTGSGLGGSSSMGCVFFYALAEHLNVKISKYNIIEIIQRIESKILNQGPAGYQDYYPSLFGGVLSLGSKMSGVSVEQIYTPELARYLQERITLVFSGESRKSGINNWEVYKNFFDRDEGVVLGLSKIRDCSLRALEALKSQNYEAFLEEVSREGRLRESLFEGIMTPGMVKLKSVLKTSLESFRGIKVCGAGGGGCFLIISDQKSEVNSLVESNGMEVLPFEIMQPVGKLND